MGVETNKPQPFFELKTCIEIHDKNQMKKVLKSSSVNQICELAESHDEDGFGLIHHCCLQDSLHMLEMLIETYR